MGVTGFGISSGVSARAGGPQGPDKNNVWTFNAGVVGTSRDSPGVEGGSINNIGVYGQTEQLGSVPNLVAGVYGTGNVRPGVIGSLSQGLGVQGASFLGTGVRGTSFRSPGIQGQSGVGTGVQGTSLRASGVTGISGTQGPTPIFNLPTIAGVLGSSDAQAGVIGTSNRTAGVLGFSNNVGVFGATTNPTGDFAGIFRGNVLVTGTLTAGVKNAAVKFPDGSQRVLHCMESPEHWFEDFGAAKLKGGRAVVKLDADFAKVVTLNEYHVFVTPEGDCCGLCVRNKTATGFEVRELQGGTSNVAFSYRIVARRKDIKAQQRFAKIDTRLPLPATAARPPRKGAPTSRELRAFIADLEKEARTGGRPLPQI